MRGLHLVDVQRLCPLADGEVDRLPRPFGEPLERLARDLRQRQAPDGEDAEPGQLRAGRETVTVPADEASRLEDGQQPRHGALVHSELGRQLRHPELSARRAEGGENRERSVGRLHRCG